MGGHQHRQRQEKTWKSANGAWFARLVVSSDGRSDRGNAFGQLADGENRFLIRLD